MSEDGDIFEAVRNCDLLLVAELLDKNPRNLSRKKKEALPLHWAAGAHDGTEDADAILALMVEKNKKLLAARDKEGQTPLHWAVKHGKVAAVKSLVRLGASLAVKDKKGNLPVNLAKHVSPMWSLLMELREQQEKAKRAAVRKTRTTARAARAVLKAGPAPKM